MYKERNLPIGYKQTKIGIIPIQWAVKSLAECFSISAGRDLMKETFSATKTIEHCFPIFSNSMENRGLYGYTSNPRYTAGSLTVTGRGTLGVAEFRTESFDAIIRLLVLTPKMELCGKLIAEYINYRKPFFFECTGIPQLTAPQISKILIPIPPIEEQKKIAEILSEWDKAIELQTKLIEKLELRKRALMQRLLTGRVRLNGFGGKWEKVKAGEVFYNSSKRSIIGEQLLSATQEYGVIPRDMLDTRVTMPSENSVENFKLVEQGDFIISLRSFQGGIEYSHYRGCISPAYTVLKNKHTINDTFYQYYFKSTDFICRLAVAVIGIRDGRQISFNDFCYVKIPEPSLSEQIAIAEVLIIADKEIEIAKTKLSSFRNQKQGLMQQLLTGKKQIMSSQISN